MKHSIWRRYFLQKVGLASMGVCLLPDTADAAMKPPKRYIGEGKNLDEALRFAVAQAEKSIRVPDGAVRWKLIEVTGRVGGFAPKTVVIATIEVQ